MFEEAPPPEDWAFTGGAAAAARTGVARCQAWRRERDHPRRCRPAVPAGVREGAATALPPVAGRTCFALRAASVTSCAGATECAGRALEHTS